MIDYVEFDIYHECPQCHEHQAFYYLRLKGLQTFQFEQCFNCKLDHLIKRVLNPIFLKSCMIGNHLFQLKSQSDIFEIKKKIVYVCDEHKQVIANDTATNQRNTTN